MSDAPQDAKWSYLLWSLHAVILAAVAARVNKTVPDPYMVDSGSTLSFSSSYLLHRTRSFIFLKPKLIALESGYNGMLN